MRALDPQDPAITYAAVLDALPIVAYMAAPDGAVTYLSRGWERFTGNSARDALERGYQDIIHPDDLPRAAAAWDRARATGLAYRNELRIRFADGSYRWVLSQADPVRGDDGAIAGWFGTLTDVHRLRLAEEGLTQALAASSASAREAAARAHFVERLLDASDDSVQVLDLDGSFEGADWLDAWSDEDRPAAAAALESARTGERGRFTGSSADDREQWWDVTVTPIPGADGTAEQLLAISRDVTHALLAHRALARSEERYRVLGEALPGVTWTATPDGLLDHIGGRASSTSGLPDAARLGDAWLATVHPDERDAVRAVWQASVESGEPYDAQFRVRALDGSYRWQLVRALPQRDAGDAIIRWVGVNIDIDDQRRADEAREQFVRLVENSDDFIGIGDEHGNATYVNEAGRRLLGIGTLDEARATHLLDYFAPEDRAFVHSDILPAIEREGRWRGDFRLRNFATGELVPISYNVFALRNETGTALGVATVSRDIRDRQRVEAGLRALAETGAAMYGSLDFEGTLRNVADAVTRSFATFSTVDVLGADATIRSIAASHHDPTAVPLLERAAAARNLSPRHPVSRAIHHNESTLLAALPADWFETFGVRAAVGGEIDRLDIRSIVFVPIASPRDGHVFGALTCARDGSDAHGAYAADDVRFAQEVAARAGAAFENARAYEREHRIAAALQEASLAKTLPAVKHLMLSADYRPGNSEATIGGDWYDAFALDDGRVAITAGDVLGNGLAAAVTMGKVRQAMRSAAMLQPEPNAMLDVADRTVRDESGDTYATAVAGIYDPVRETFVFASAGHPGPALRHPGGRIEEFTSPGMMLGLRARGEQTTATVPALPSSVLVFFTDGLVEATRDIEEGHARLHAAMTDPRVIGAANPAHALVEHVLAGRAATDDIAVLVAEIAPSRG